VVIWKYRCLTVDMAPTFVRCFCHNDLLGDKKGRYFYGSGPTNVRRRRNAPNATTFDGKATSGQECGNRDGAGT
jgi:hypothetical protein